MKLRSTIASGIVTGAVLVAIAVFSPALLDAQEARGTITGRVRDNRQGVIPGAKVKVTNSQMGVTVAVSTNEDGLYSVPLLIPGAYQILVEADGFKRALRDGVV